MPREDQYILDRPTGRSLRARDALLCILVATLLLVLLKGQSLQTQAEKLDPGLERTLLTAVGRPTSWIADAVGLTPSVDNLTASLSPDATLTGDGGFATAEAERTTHGSSAAATITPDNFDPAELGAKPDRLPRLKTLLVTGDSLSQPLDQSLARALAGRGVTTIRDAHLGTAISKTDIVDWGLLSRHQAKRKPDAVVMFMGANEGFPFPAADGKPIQCCGVDWAVTYAARAREMMNIYRRSGAARVYWLTVPGPRVPARQTIARTVNAAIGVAAQPYRSQVRVLDLIPVFTPGYRYAPAISIDGRSTIVRRPDGIHLNEAGADVVRDLVITRLEADFAHVG